MVAPSHRYNLRSKSGRVYPENDLVKPKSQESSTFMKSSEYAKSDNQSLLAPLEPAPWPLPANSRLLYQAPQKWTIDHLRIANVEHKPDVPLEGIVDARYVPTDSDPDFERIASQFQVNIIEDTDADLDPYDIGDKKNPFFPFFVNMRRCKQRGCYASYDDNIEVVGIIIGEMYPDRSLAMKRLGRLPLSVASLKAGKGVWVAGTILRISKATDEMGVPLCVVSRKKEPGDIGMARYEVPQLLLEANMVFNYDKNFENYEAFLISAEGHTYTIVRAIVSAAYLRSIRAGRPASGTFQALRSRSFDITYWDARKEFLRCIMALGRYFVQRPEFSFPMRKYRLVG